MKASSTRSNVINMNYHEKPKLMTMKQMFEYNYSHRTQGSDNESDDSDRSSFDIRNVEECAFAEDEEEEEVELMDIESRAPSIVAAAVSPKVDEAGLRNRIISAVNKIDIYEIFKTPKSSSKLMAEISLEVLKFFNTGFKPLSPEDVMLNEQLKRKAQLYLLPDHTDLFISYGSLGKPGFDILKDYLASKYQFSDLMKEKKRQVEIWENKSFLGSPPYLWWWPLFCNNVVFHIFCLEVNVHLLKELKSMENISLDEAYYIARDPSSQVGLASDSTTEDDEAPSKKRKQT